MHHLLLDERRSGTVSVMINQLLLQQVILGWLKRRLGTSYRSIWSISRLFLVIASITGRTSWGREKENDKYRSTWQKHERQLSIYLHDYLACAYYVIPWSLTGSPAPLAPLNLNELWGDWLGVGGTKGSLSSSWFLSGYQYPLPSRFASDMLKTTCVEIERHEHEVIYDLSLEHFVEVNNDTFQQTRTINWTDTKLREQLIIKILSHTSPINSLEPTLS